MSVPTKSIGTSLLAMQSIATGLITHGSAVDVASLFSALLWIKLGRTTTTALTGSPQFQVEGSTQGSGDTGWWPLWSAPLLSDPALDLVAAESEAVTGTVAAGATSITLASTANLTIGEYIALSNGAASELRRIKALIANTNLTVDPLVGAATGLTLFDNAQVIPVRLDLNHVKRIRGHVSTNGVGSSVLVEMIINTLDSVG